MKTTILFLILFLMIGLAYAGDPYIIDENMNLRENDIYNATHVNATYVYQNGTLMMDEATLLAYGYYNALANFTGTLTDAKWCIYDSANTEIDCNVEPLVEANLNVNSSTQLIGFTSGSVLYVDSSGIATENNSHLYYDDSNGGSLAVGDTTDMRNIFQAVKAEGITNIDNVKALIAVRNTETTNNNWVGYTWQTDDTNGDTTSVFRIMTQILNHAAGAVSANTLFEIRNNGAKMFIMNMTNDGIEIYGDIKAQDWTNVTITESQISDHTTYTNNSWDLSQIPNTGNVDIGAYNMTTTAGINLNDNVKIRFGTDDDACIYWDGSSLITSTIPGDCG